MLVHKQHEPSDSKIDQNSFQLIDSINTFGGKISGKDPIGGRDDPVVYILLHTYLF